jgi:hypothetical protein
MCLLRNHSLKPKLRQRGEQLLAFTNDVIRLPEVRRLFQIVFQQALPFTQRLIPKILSHSTSTDRTRSREQSIPSCFVGLRSKGDRFRPSQLSRHREWLTAP